MVNKVNVFETHIYTPHVAHLSRQAMQASLNSAQMRRSKFLAALPAAPPVPKRKKDAVVKETWGGGPCMIRLFTSICVF